MSDNYHTQFKSVSKGKLPEECIIVIFGGAGDLSHKELLPSLFALFNGKFLPHKFSIIGFDKVPFNDDGYRTEMKKAASREKSFNEKSWSEFSQRLFYLSGDFNDEPSGSYLQLQKKIDEVQAKFEINNNILFHLAVPPVFYGTIIKRLNSIEQCQNSSGWRRVIIEKPFGTDENSARELDNLIHESLQENQIFRVDHFLGKETVQNMLVFRFANAGFEPIWNRNYIDNIQITVAEDTGIGTRGSFYDRTGVIRDMMQNHLMALLCIAALEPPLKFNAASLRSGTKQVLNAISPINVEADCVLGQYDAGYNDNHEIISYRNENNVNKNSMVPTFIAVKLYLDNWRWAGVPFYLRTGKRLKNKLTEITIRFKPTPHLMFPDNHQFEKKGNILTFRLQPNEGIIYQFIAKEPGAELKLSPVNLIFDYATSFGIEEPPSAYQWLIFDALEGDQTLFPDSEWIYKSWSIIDPIIKKWEQKPWLEFPNYKAGSWGPEASDDLIKKDGHMWIANQDIEDITLAKFKRD